MSAFKKLEHKKKREYVASQIMEAIRNGTFKVGDKLPSEQAMAESIGVSRPSIREALGALRIVGIIETINGVGTVVKKDNVEFLSDGFLHFRFRRRAFQCIMRSRQEHRQFFVDHAQSAANSAFDFNFDSLISSDIFSRIF